MSVSPEATGTPRMIARTVTAKGLPSSLSATSLSHGPKFPTRKTFLRGDDKKNTILNNKSTNYDKYGLQFQSNQILCWMAKCKMSLACIQVSDSDVLETSFGSEWISLRLNLSWSWIASCRVSVIQEVRLCCVCHKKSLAYSELRIGRSCSWCRV